MRTLFGTETEYGIFVAGKEPSDLVNESIAVVRSYPLPAAGPWDYRGEDARRDMRGYRVDHLNHNPDDARFDKPGQKQMSVHEERSDRVLQNGARLYNDHGHPEYSTPECASLREMVAHDKAGERIVFECARRRTESGTTVTIYKNNTDYHGMSYGSHEGYLYPRETPFEALLAGLTPFLVTRQIYAGAGKVGAEVRASSMPIFQLSQRADYFSVLASVDTLHQRPIFNTRDEPHADPRKYRRVHVICGDANLSEVAIALKIGATRLALDLVRTGWQCPFVLKDPVAAVQDISRDQSWLWYATLDSGKKARATEIQRAYLNAAMDRLDVSDDPDAQWVLTEWQTVLDCLERDPLELADRLDWVAKRSLLEQYLKEEGLDWADELAQSLDLEYSNVDPDQGLYYGLEQMGGMRRFVTDEEIEAALTQPPEDTRAWIRGEMVRRFAPLIRACGWNKITVEQDGQTSTVDLNPYAERLDPALREQLCGAETVADWVQALSEV